MRILAPFLLLLLIGCAQAPAEKRGRDCSIRQTPEGQFVSCDDDTTHAIPMQQPGCRAEALNPNQPKSGGVIISCPPDFEPLVIPNATDGPAGPSCELRNVVARNEKVLVCNGQIVVVGS